MKQKVLFDTDIGSDIDDAVCLAYLLAQPDCELLGITTVTGQAVKRAQLADVLCRVAGQSIPIFPGAELPLMGTKPFQPEVPQAAALGRWPHSVEFPHGQAVEFLRQTIRAHPGEVTLLTVGPLTNVALLVRTDPEAVEMLKGLVMMCGVFTNRLANVGPLEWNALGDPHATAICYSAPAYLHRSVGLDVTCQVTMPADEVRRKFTHELLLPVKDFAEVWFNHAQHITFHDPLAGVTIFNDSVCQFERGSVVVDVHSRLLAGYTHWQAEEHGKHEVALQVSPDKFFESFFSVFK